MTICASARENGAAMGAITFRKAPLPAPPTHREAGPPAERRHGRALLLSRSDETPIARRLVVASKSGGKLASACSTTRASHAAASKRQDATDIQLSSCPGP